MFRRITILAGGLAMLLCASPASAGIYADDLSKCLVSQSGADGQTLLVKWIFAIMTLNPAVAPYSTVTDAQRADVNKQASALFMKLLTVDCRAQSVAALKYEGPRSLEPAFETLGEVAMRGLMSDPKVAAGMAGLGSDMDKSQIEALGREAGMPIPQNAPAK